MDHSGPTSVQNMVLGVKTSKTRVREKSWLILVNMLVYTGSNHKEGVMQWIAKF